MTLQFLRVTIIAALVLVYFNDSTCVFAQHRPGAGSIGFGGLGRWDPAAPRAGTLPQPGPRPRRWSLYFPPDWRHPAIIRPPVKVYLDPPYGWEDPFGRFPNPQPVDNPSIPAPADPVVELPAQPPREIPRPKVLELNRSTGRLEQRNLGPIEGQPGVTTEEGPAPPPADGVPRRRRSPFQDLRRWDALPG
jgi:hypothetical protein